MKIEVIRKEYLADRTIGCLEIDGTFYCYTLEDKVRPDGVKVYGETAIPEGTYKFILAPFRGDVSKMYPHLQDVPMFTGVCLHGGNRPEDTIGCILVAFNRSETEIQGSAIKDLCERIRKGHADTIIVRNGG